MALPVNIDDLINHRKVEWARIEYKEGWNPEKVLHTLCAFANDIDNWGGGYIIIGIAEENGRPVFPIKGIEPNEVDVIQKELLNVCHLIEPVFSSPENRDWLSVILPVNPHFREMENPISERTALKTALTSQRGTHKEEGEERGKFADSGRVVEVMTAEEELAHIKVALKTALKTALIHRSAKVVERMGILLQQLLRDKDTTIVALASLLGASRRTVQEDIAILKGLKVIDRVGPDNGGEWIVQLKW